MHFPFARRSGVLALLAALCGSAAAADDIIQDCEQCPRMVPIAPGSFMMGHKGFFLMGKLLDEKKRFEPVELHPALVKERFAIGQTEVTRAQFRYFVGRTGYVGGSDDDGLADANLPVTGVDWYAARAYTRWLSRYTGQRYRLPFEEEWEYAARAGTDTRYWWGDRQADACASEHVPAAFFGPGNKPCTAAGPFALRPVASLRANPWGMYDMLGNADEWTIGCIAGSATVAKDMRSGVDACWSYDTPRVVRGAGDDMVAIGRNELHPLKRLPTLGFRVVRELK